MLSRGQAFFPEKKCQNSRLDPKTPAFAGMTFVRTCFRENDGEGDPESLYLKYWKRAIMIPTRAAV